MADKNAIVLTLRRGTKAENDAFTGAEAELSVDTTNMELRLHDGKTAGGKVVGGKVKTVNGVEPDASGNVAVAATPPAISATATTLAAGSAATVTRSGTDAAPSFVFGIPQGVKGDTGDMGPQGPRGATGPQGPAGAGVSQIGSKTFSSTAKIDGGTYTRTSGHTLTIERDAYGRVINATLVANNCNCNCDCNTD